MVCSGFNISMSALSFKFFALISPGPWASKINFLGPGLFNFKDNALIFKTISVTSSLMPLIEENS